MFKKIAFVSAVLTAASFGQAHAGGLLGGILSGNSNKGALIVVSPSVDLGLNGLLSNNGILNGNSTGILNGILNGNKTSVDGIDNSHDGGKKKRR